MKFGCSFGIYLNSANLICRSTDISGCFRGSLRLRDNESRLYLINRPKNLKHEKLMELISRQSADKFKILIFTVNLIKEKDIITILCFSLLCRPSIR